MAVIKPTVAVTFGGDEQTKMLTMEELAKLMKETGNLSSSTGQEDSDKVDTPAEEKDDENEETDKEEQEKSNLPVGSVSEVKNIYKSSTDKDGEWTWVSKYPEDVEEPAENAVTDTYAVLVRNIKSPDGRKKLEAHSIVVQSPGLRQVLGEVVLKDYPGVACELDKLEFTAPFHPFVHRWPELVELMRSDDLEDKTREHLQLLHDVLQYEIGDSIKACEDYVRKGVISFKHLWMIFQPGSVILAAHKGPLSAFELAYSDYMQTQCGKFLQLRADCIDFNGKEFGRYTESISLPEFNGTKKITSLGAFPLDFHEHKAAVTESLIRRGQLFESLAGHYYKSYDGIAIRWDRHGEEMPVQLAGRIVIDIHSFNRSNVRRRRLLDDWSAKDLERLHEHREQHGLAEAGHLRLTPYHAMLARTRTRGYSLKRKEWLEFFIEQVGEIKWNDDAFDKLVLPDDQKELIMAFSEAQLKAAGDGADFDDVISGKGRGIICLLSGPPGVGKTLTAEAVAENLRVPLHTLSSGDLGSQSGEVESGLSRILELVARWNAILLLDECDVFLEARSAHDLERNKVVSIFLRTLEYYEGILFMTTNRVENIDAAFQSRIHVSLEYPDLNAESRVQIWKNFLGAFREAPEVTDEDVEELARLKLNGRQIKNVLKTAQLLASRRKSVLKRSYIDTVLAIETRRPDGAATGR